MQRSGDSFIKDMTRTERGAFVLVCVLVPLVLAVVASTIAWFVFGIMFLDLDKEVCGEDSYFWIYSITLLFVVGLIFPLLGLIFYLTFLSKYHEVLTVTMIILSSVLMAWGAYVLFYETCPNMQYTGLFIWVLITYFALGSIVVCGLCAFAGIIDFNPNSEDDEDESIIPTPSNSTSASTSADADKQDDSPLLREQRRSRDQGKV